MPTQALQTTIQTKLEEVLQSVLETYSNVHRGSGHNSMVTTALYEEARKRVLNYLDLPARRYTVIFCSPYASSQLIRQIPAENHQLLSSESVGLHMGVRALVVRNKDLPSGDPALSGGGTTKMIAKDWIIWADGPDKFEAGTPAIVNVILFAKALQLTKNRKIGVFKYEDNSLTAENLMNQDDLKGLSGKALLEALRSSLVGQTLEVPTARGKQSFVNLDNSASTPTFSSIRDVFLKSLDLHGSERARMVDLVRKEVSEFLHAPALEYEVLFTSNTTGAVNMAAQNLRQDQPAGLDYTVLNTLMEHTSNDLPWRLNGNKPLIQLGVSKEGLINLKELENTLDDYNEKKVHGNLRIGLVSVTGASNVLGICNDLAAIAEIVHRYDAKLFVDAAQLVAHRPINMEADGIDFLAFSAHKIYAPFGCGVLLARKGLLQFNKKGANQLKSLDEENTAGIAALGKSLSILKHIGMDLVEKEELELNQKLMTGLATVSGLSVYGIKDPDHELFNQKLGVALFQFKGKSPGSTAKKIAQIGSVGVRFGCHCAHLIVKHILGVGPRLEKLQRVILRLFPKLKFQGLVRASLGLQNTEADIDRLVETLNTVAAKSKEGQDIKKVKKEMKAFVQERVQLVFGDD